MRIGLFTDTYPPNINGVATSVCMLKKALEKKGHQVFLVTVNPDNMKFVYEDNGKTITNYGTLKDIVFKKLDEGINVILEIDVNGAKQVRKNYKNALLIFLRPRSLEELEYRLRNRRTDSDEAIKERLNKAIYEISNSGIYDYVIESGSKEEDYEKVKNIIEYEKKQENM